MLPLTIILLLISSSLPALCQEADQREVEFEGFQVAPDLVEETIEDAVRSGDEQNKNAQANRNTNKHPFDKACPYGYFICDNGECIAPRWRCDGHADCDDFSDELNCTSPDLAQHQPLDQSANLTKQLRNITAAHLASLPVQVYGLDFNSTVEPLMIFSTGQSVRGFWMRSRVYFDIVTRRQSHQLGETTSQPSISEAFSLFFGILGLESARSPLSGAGGQEGPSVLRVEEPGSKPDNTIVGLDMNPTNKEVFWVELGKDPGVYSAVIEDEQFESRHRRQFHGHKKLVEFGLLSPEDIALDTVGRNAYITDAGLPAVVVCSYVHVHCRILIQTKIHKPRAIIADSTSGWVIFTDWGDRPGILLVTMDGRRRETLIDTDVVWPNGLAQDFASNTLFWADARLNKIEKVDLQTRKRLVLRKETESNPFSVAVFENRIYWSDWSGNDIKTCDKHNGSSARNVIHADDIYGIHIYHPDDHKAAEQTNPCWSKHCSHLCLLSPASTSTLGRPRQEPIGATCACPDSMALSIFNKATCYEVHLSFLLINVKNYIAQVFPEKIGLRVLEEIVYSKEHAIQDIASDWLHYKLYFFDASRRQILLADFSDGRATFQKFLTIQSKAIRSMSYDFLSDNLFWLDPELGTLTLCSVRGAKFQKVLRHDLEDPAGMVLDTKNRVIYVALAGPKPRLFRTDMMGSSASDVPLLESNQLGEPVAIYLDEQQQRLYWADANFGSIDSVELDVKSRKSGYKFGTRIRHRGRLGPILSFAVYQNYLMWIVKGSDYLYKAPTNDRNARPVSFKLPPSPNSALQATDYRRLITVNPMGETLSSPCLKRGCSHACMVDRERETKCICPDGFRLQTANRSNCVDGSKPEPVSVPTPMQQAELALLHGDKHPISAHEIDELTHNPAPNGTELHTIDTTHGSVSHYKSSDQPHLNANGHFSNLLDEAQLEHTQHQAAGSTQHTDAQSAASASTAGAQNPVGSNKVVWLITFLLVLATAGLITVVSLMIMNKQTRWPSQLTVSFSSAGRRGDGSALLLGAEDE